MRLWLPHEWRLWWSNINDTINIHTCSYARHWNTNRWLTSKGISIGNQYEWLRAHDTMHKLLSLKSGVARINSYLKMSEFFNWGKMDCHAKPPSRTSVGTITILLLTITSEAICSSLFSHLIQRRRPSTNFSTYNSSTGLAHGKSQARLWLNNLQPVYLKLLRDQWLWSIQSLSFLTFKSLIRFSIVSQAYLWHIVYWKQF